MNINENININVNLGVTLVFGNLVVYHRSMLLV